MIRFAPLAARLAAPLAALLALGALAAAPAHAQAVQDPDAREVAMTPLRDLGIDARDIPEVLKAAERAPYAMAGLSKCPAIVAEIAGLDSVLGADYDIAEGKNGNKLSGGRIGQAVMGAAIPFRGIVREVTGAASNDRNMQAAYTAGMARRAFLKGLGRGRGCAYPARPKG